MQELAVQFKHISMEFPGVLANDDVSLDIRRGEVFALVGENGAGKTTLMNILYGINEPTDGEVIIGGYLPLLHAGHRVGKGDTIVLESCEYCDSFLNFFPTLAVVLNVEADHLDYFKDLADIQKSFHKFAGMATDGVIANGDDPHTVEALEGIEYTSFGLGEGNQVTAANISPDWRHFDVLCGGEFYCHLDLGVRRALGCQVKRTRPPAS